MSLEDWVHGNVDGNDAYAKHVGGLMTVNVVYHDGTDTYWWYVMAGIGRYAGYAYTPKDTGCKDLLPAMDKACKELSRELITAASVQV